MSKWKAIKKERNENTQKDVATKETITLNISETCRNTYLKRALNNQKFKFQINLENVNIELVFNSLKTKNYSSYKDQFPNDLKSFLADKIFPSSRSSSYIGEACGHFKTRIEY